MDSQFPNDQHQHFACDQSTARVDLRTDLRVTPCDSSRSGHVVIEDPVSGAFYRLGKYEYIYATLLCSSRTVAQAFQALCERFSDQPLSQDDAIELSKWLVTNQLAHTESSRSVERMNQSARKATAETVKQSINPLTIRMPLLNPDGYVEALNRRLGWIVSPRATAVSAVLIVVASILALTSWRELSLSTAVLFSGSSLVTLAFITLILKVIHEFSHALTCNRYGGEIGEMGVLMILFAPLAYVDVSSVWRFRSRWQRIHVAAAGILTELSIASVAMLVWCASDDAYVKHLCVSTMLSASVTTLLFNANPLMKFDGYFILIDWLRTPNLYTESQQHLARIGRRLFFGDRSKEPDCSAGYRNFTLLYGLMAWTWKWFVCAGLVLAASKIMHGLGMILAVLAVVLWFALPFAQLIKNICKKPAQKRRRCLLVTASIVLTLVISTVIAPWPGANRVPGIVEYSPHQIVRAQVAGFVQQIHVQPGETVAVDQPLVTLMNHDLLSKANQTNTLIQQAKIRQRKQLLSGNRAASQSEQAEIDALTAQSLELDSEKRALTIRARQSGIVVKRGLDELLGTYVEKGSELLVIGDEHRKELRLLISQNEYDRFRESIGTSVQFQTAERKNESSTLLKIIPRARNTVDYPALLTANGGPLPVRSVRNQANAGDQFELLAPHFEAVVPLSKRQSQSLWCGQRTKVSVEMMHESVARHLWRKLAPAVP